MPANYGKTDVGSGDFSANWSRGMTIPANTFAAGETILKSVSIRVQGTHTAQVRVTVYQGDDLNDPDGDDLIRDFGTTSGSATNTFLTLNAGDETLDVTRHTRIWIKGNDSGFFTAADDGAGDPGDFDPDNGRYESVAVSSNEATAYPDPWPADTGSQADFWYSWYITVDTTKPEIDTCVPSVTLLPDSTGVVATGAKYGASQGTSKIQLSDNATYGSGTLVDQTVNTWSDTSIDFDIALGALSEGDLFLFVVLDPGGGGEDPSLGFPVNVRTADDKYEYKRLVTQAGTGNQDLTGVGFEPIAARIFCTSNTSQNSAQTDQRQHVYLWTPAYSVVAGAGHETGGPGPGSRHQVSGDLVIRDGGAGTILAVATVTALADGLRFNWSQANSGHTLHCELYGGTVTAKCDTVAANSSPVVDVPFPLDLLMASSIGLAAMPSATTEGPFSAGFASGTAAANQVCMRIYPADFETNAVLQTGVFAGQIGGLTSQWTTTLSAINDDGFAWTGSDADVFHYLALHFRSLGVNVGSFTKDSSGDDDATQQIGAQGHVAGFASFLNAHRTSQTISHADACNSIGSGKAGGDDGSYIITDETDDNADEATHTSEMVRGGNADAVSDAIGSITSWTDNPTVTWSTNDTVAAIVGYLTIEALVVDQTLTQDEVPFMGIVSSPAIAVGAAPAVEQDPLPFMGTVGGGEVMEGVVFINAMQVPFMGLVGEGTTNVINLINDAPAPSFMGLITNHKLVQGAVAVTNDVVPFMGIVPSPTIPTPGVSPVVQLETPFLGIVPSPTIVAGAAPAITQDETPFLGIVPAPALLQAIAQDETPFLGLVGDPAVLVGSVPLAQGALSFFGIVPAPTVTVAVATIVSNEVPFMGLVPAPNLTSELQQDEVPFMGLVPAPTVVADPAPTIVQDEVPFMGIVPAPNLSQQITQQEVPFMGIVPAPFQILLNDPDERTITVYAGL